MLVIGYGKLAHAIIQRVVARKNTTVAVYNRTRAVVDADPDCTYVSPEHFHRYSQVLIALPAQAYADFFRRWGGRFTEGTSFFYSATKVMKADMNDYLQNNQIAVPCKLAGHADILRTMGEGAFAFEKEESREPFIRWCDGAFDTMIADEESILKGNAIATEESLRALLKLEQRLQQEHVADQVIEAVSASIPGGIAKAHKYGTHGHFATEVLNEWRGGKNDD
ncbi:hypothetical protein [Natribacillus halophilus]|uniref:Pyrroline-5-carboxylate reductase catalytic N-terminal domain-containing protein n=1 Tax=Natribacillus halophilus TaxID=549003 RepID=A0A1G8NGM8_9BACI|nr:hypothetical protein [Natribacillus halophilus]SDI79394.1 hypothetical protein SAMN04488123_10676 [Natribacillus halophilus]